MYITATLKILFISVAVGLDVFAVSVGIGMRGSDRASHFRIGAIFASAEVAMTVLGALLGAAAGKYLGPVAGYFGFGALTLVGAYMIVETRRKNDAVGFDVSHGWGLLFGALAISVDSFGIGFSILFIGVPLPLSIACIAGASIVSTTLGLRLGKALGLRIGETAALWAGIILCATGIAFSALKYVGNG